MKGISTLLAMVAVGAAAVLLGATQLMASGQGSQATRFVPVEPDPEQAAITRLRSFEEVPAISTPGDGLFDLFIGNNDNQVDWRLNYAGLAGNVTQAHLHFAQRGVNGGIVVFLCSNLGNGPPGTQNCPASGNIAGSFTSSAVGSGANAQGIAPGELGEVLRAIRAGVVYANVHTDLFPGGEIRGQLSFGPGGPRSDSGNAPSAPAIPAPSGPTSSDGGRGPGG